MRRQIVAWALTGVMAAGHAVGVDMPWHDDDDKASEAAMVTACAVWEASNASEYLEHNCDEVLGKGD